MLTAAKVAAAALHDVGCFGGWRRLVQATVVGDDTGAADEGAGAAASIAAAMATTIMAVVVAV